MESATFCPCTVNHTVLVVSFWADTRLRGEGVLEQHPIADHVPREQLWRWCTCVWVYVSVGGEGFGGFFFLGGGGGKSGRRKMGPHTCICKSCPQARAKNSICVKGVEFAREGVTYSPFLAGICFCLFFLGEGMHSKDVRCLSEPCMESSSSKQIVHVRAPYMPP